MQKEPVSVRSMREKTRARELTECHANGNARQLRTSRTARTFLTIEAHRDEWSAVTSAAATAPTSTVEADGKRASAILGARYSLVKGSEAVAALSDEVRKTRSLGRTDGRASISVCTASRAQLTAKVEESLRIAMQGTTRKGLWIEDTEGKTGARDVGEKPRRKAKTVTRESAGIHLTLCNPPDPAPKTAAARSPCQPTTSLSKARQTEKNPALFAQMQSAASPPASFPDTPSSSTTGPP